MGDLARQDGPGLCLQGGDVRLRLGRGRGGLPLPDLLQMRPRPGLMGLDEGADGGVRGPQGGADPQAAVLCDLQRQGPPAGADNVILHHAPSIAEAASLCKRRGGRAISALWRAGGEGAGKGPPGRQISANCTLPVEGKPGILIK